jgi:hypothetical protein
MDYVWLWQQHIKTTRPLEKLDHQRLGPFFIMIQINVVTYEHPSFVSCFFVGTLPHVYYSKMNSWTPPLIEVNMEQEYEMEKNLDFRIFYHQFQLLVLIMFFISVHFPYSFIKFLVFVFGALLPCSLLVL